MQSRYYNPKIGRFINADVLTSTGQGLLGNNMYAYSLNNPVNLHDPNGMCSYSVYYGGKVPDGNCYRCAQYTSKYDVPLYDQGDTHLCWAFCTLMTSDYKIGIERTEAEAYLAAQYIAMVVNGKDDWNRGNVAQNCAAYDASGQPIAVDIESFVDLAIHLKENGPIYARYKAVNKNKEGYHYYQLVVVTGVDYYKGLVYTNNPWGISGVQTYDEFLHGFAGASSANPYELVCYFPISKDYYIVGNGG